MMVRLSHSSNVIGLFDVLNTANVNQLMEGALQQASNQINDEELKHWELDFNCFYKNGTHIHVAKSTKPYVQDKQKIVVIGIPIPTVDVVPWGVLPKQHMYVNTPADSEKYYTPLKLDFKESQTLCEHVVRCVKTGIAFALADGIIVMGRKIKVKDPFFERWEKVEQSKKIKGRTNTQHHLRQSLGRSAPPQRLA